MKKVFIICLCICVVSACKSKNLKVSQEGMVKVAKQIEVLLEKQSKDELMEMIQDDHSQTEGGKKEYVALLIKWYLTMRKENHALNFEDISTSKISYDGVQFFYNLCIGVTNKDDYSNINLYFKETKQGNMIFWDVSLNYIEDGLEKGLPTFPF